LYQSFFAFLHNRDIAENGGVFVTRVRSLVSQVPKGAIFKPGVDTTKMNPSMAGGAATLPTGNFARGPRDIYQGLDVIIIKGSHKGHIGIIKDTNGPSARVEVSSKNKILTMSMEMLGGRG
jgi:transcription elongation factor SPT5